MTGGHYLDQLPISPAYRRVEGLLERGGCVLLDGGIATELQRVRSEDRAQRREPWGTWALFRGPMEVLEVHRRYVASGCDVISTNTWSVLEAAEESNGEAGSVGHTPLWLDAARLGVRLARQAIAEAGREAECSTAFSINSGLIDERASGRLELLSWMWSEVAPDLVILETLETVPDEAGLRTIEMLCDTGLPVWVSFRRRKEGMSTVDGPDRSRCRLRRLRAGPRADARDRGRRRAGQLRPRRPPRRDDALAARADPDADRLLSEPRSQRRLALGVRRRDRAARVRPACRVLGRRGCADRRRLLRGDP
jgi:hypothetical protein